MKLNVTLQSSLENAKRQVHDVNDVKQETTRPERDEYSRFIISKCPNGEDKLIKIASFFDLSTFLISTVSSNLLEYDCTWVERFREVNNVQTSSPDSRTCMCLFN